MSRGLEDRTQPLVGDGLRRVISFWDASALVVGMIVGSGIFRTPATVAAHLPVAFWIMVAWTIGGLLSLAGGIAAAELGARFPRSGGQYVFLQEAFGPSVAFAFGWTEILIGKPSILAGISTVFASYCAPLVGLGDGSQRALAMGAIALLTFVNCLGVKSGTRAQNFLTAVKVAGLGLLGVGVFVSGRGDWSHFSAGAGRAAESMGSVASSAAGAVPVHPLPIALALALVSILYTYDGWIDVTYSGGEVVNPRRALPRAILGGTLACMGLYLLANAAYIYILSPAEMAGATRVAADALTRAFGGAGGQALAVLVVVSTLGVLNGSILTGVRVPYAMAVAGMLFAPLGRLHRRTLSPVNALVAQGLFACVILLVAETFEQIASLFVDTTWTFYAVSFAGLLWIQRRESRTRRADPAESDVRFPFSTLAAVIFILVTVVIVGSDLVYGNWRVRTGMVVVAAGIPAYHIWRVLTARRVRA